MNELDFVSWFGHASFSFIDNTSGNRIYYIDPFDLKDKNLQKADIIFITHAHLDHNSEIDLKKILQTETTIIAPNNVLDKINFHDQKLNVEPNKSYMVKGFSFQTVPAYNIKSERLFYHPKANNWVGYILNINNKKVYHAGDTDFIPEMNGLKKLHLDVALLPMGGTYTMAVDETIQAANAISAKITIPMHYKKLLRENYKTAEEKLKKSVINSQVIILNEID